LYYGFRLIGPLPVRALTLLVCCLCCVSGTEQQLMPALDVLFRIQVI
jgi:hypothetical protein